MTDDALGGDRRHVLIGLVNALSAFKPQGMRQERTFVDWLRPSHRKRE
jgi:hypothetical protein